MVLEPRFSRYDEIFANSWSKFSRNLVKNVAKIDLGFNNVSGFSTIRGYATSVRDPSFRHNRNESPRP